MSANLIPLQLDQTTGNIVAKTISGIGGTYIPPTGTGFQYVISGSPTTAAVTPTAATALLNLFSSSLQGLVPASGGGTTNFLRADGTWVSPGVGTGVTSFNTRTGAIVLTSGDVNSALGFAPGVGTVTSVAASGSTGLVVTGSPITSNGTLTFTLGSELQGLAILSTVGFVQRTGPGSYTAASLTSGQITTALGFTPYNATNPAGYITGNQTITVTGDITGSGSTVLALTLPNIATAGTYNSVTVNSKGQVVSGSNPTTLAGYGITDAVSSQVSTTLANAVSLTFQSGGTIHGIPTPAVSTDVANKAYVDSKSSVPSVAGTTSQILVNGTSGTAQTGAIILTLPSTINVNTSGNAATATLATTATIATTATTATSVAGGATGSLVYQLSAGTSSTLPLGTTNYVLTAGASAPQYVAQSTLSVGSATNATNVLTTSSSTNQNYPVMLSSGTSTGYQSPAFNATLAYNPSTAILSLPSTGVVSALQFTSIATTGTAPLVISSTTQVNNLTSQYATNAANITIAATTTNAPFYLTMVSATSGSLPLDVDSGLTLNPNTGALTVPGTITITSGTVTNLTSPVNASDAATKGYVDASATGISILAASKAATTTDLTTLGTWGTVTYTAGSTDQQGGTGIGATLTPASVGALIIDGYTVLLNDNVLIKNQTTQTQNGIYALTTLGTGSVHWVLTRSTYYNDSVSGSPQVKPGGLTFIQNGTVNTNSSWAESGLGSLSGNAIKIGTDNIIFTQFSNASSYSAGTGLSLTGTVFANTGVLSLTTNTGLSTNVSATGNVTITNTGVTSIVAGSNIAVSGATGAVTISLSGTVPLATTSVNLSGTTQYSIPFQSGSATTTYLSPSTIGYVLITNSTGSAPSWSNTPTLVGTNFTSIPNSALTNNSITIGSTNVALGATSTSIAGLTSVNSTSFTGALTGNASSATNIAGGALGSIPYQSGSSATNFLSPGTSGQVLTSTGSAAPVWASLPFLTPIAATTTYTASAYQIIIADTSSSAFTITLPLSPVLGQIIYFIDGAGTWTTNPLTIAGNGANIVGNSVNLTANLSYENFSLVYYNSTQGWILGP